MQSYPDAGAMVFGVNTWNRWSNAAQNKYQISIDVNGDSVPDYAVYAADLGQVTTGSPSGATAVVVYDLSTGIGDIQLEADAPFNSTTMTLTVYFDQLCTRSSACLSSSNPRFTYSAVAFGPGGSVDGTASAKFNAFTPAVSTGMFDVLDPGASTHETVSYNPTEFALTPPLGFLIISHDNMNTLEAQEIAFTP